MNSIAKVQLPFPFNKFATLHRIIVRTLGTTDVSDEVNINDQTESQYGPVVVKGVRKRLTIRPWVLEAGLDSPFSLSVLVAHYFELDFEFFQAIQTGNAVVEKHHRHRVVQVEYAILGTWLLPIRCNYEPGRFVGKITSTDGGLV